MRDVSVRQQEEKIARLSDTARMAFCCGCLEHALPFYERVVGREDLRPAIDYLWSCVVGGAVSGTEVRKHDQIIAARIPDSEDDGSVEASIHRSVAVAVLESLDAAQGSPDAAIRVGSLVLDTLTFATTLFRQITPVPQREHITVADDAPELSLEWRHQEEMVAELASWVDGREALVWRERHRQMGQDLLGRFRGVS